MTDFARNKSEFSVVAKSRFCFDESDMTVFLPTFNFDVFFFITSCYYGYIYFITAQFNSVMGLISPANQCKLYFANY